MNGWTLVQTCGACPEQYNAYDEEGQQVGYLRLRHGYFAAYRDASDNEPVYSARTIGDGIFDPSERDEQLSRAVAALQRYDGS